MIIGYTTGVFDLFHIGHLNIIKKAKELCDFLVVGVSTDELVEHEKHKRMQIVESVKYVDKVVPQYNKNKMEAWERIKFNRMFVGSDWQGSPQWQSYEEQFSKTGVEIIYLPHTEGISSTILEKRWRDGNL